MGAHSARRIREHVLVGGRRKEGMNESEAGFKMGRKGKEAKQQKEDNVRLFVSFFLVNGMQCPYSAHFYSSHSHSFSPRASNHCPSFLASRPYCHLLFFTNTLLYVYFKCQRIKLLSCTIYAQHSTAIFFTISSKYVLLYLI
jgi:hypothetical protein